jgi:hypothetical protein
VVREAGAEKALHLHRFGDADPCCWTTERRTYARRYLFCYRYSGHQHRVVIQWLSAEDMAHRITENYERALTTDVSNIDHIESQSTSGVSVVKVFLHPGADINRAIAETASNSALILRVSTIATLIGVRA